MAEVTNHPYYKLGLLPAKNAPALMASDFLTGVVPAHPASVDHFGKFVFGLYGKDKYGVCGPTSVANLVRLVTGGLLGKEVQPTQADVYDLYRRSGNPQFNPSTDADDNGVDMQTMLEALLKGGIGGIKPVAFAKVDPTNQQEMDAAVSIFGGCLWGIDLQVAQQAQTDLDTPLWDYKKSAEWGGHAVLHGTYEMSSGQKELNDVISWAERVETTPTFRSHQLQEVWVVVWFWNLDHPAFQAGVDLNALEAAYKALTGKTLPVTPTPIPAPPSWAPEDTALWNATKAWSKERHVAGAHNTAVALQSWAKKKGFS